MAVHCAAKGSRDASVHLFICLVGIMIFSGTYKICKKFL